MFNWFSTKVSRPFDGKRIISSTNSAGTTGYLHAKEWIWTFTSHHSSKWIKDLNVRSKTIKLLEGNTEINLPDLGLHNGFSDITPEA